MKSMKLMVLSGLTAMVLMAFFQVSWAQDAKPQKSPKASVTQRIGVDTDIEIDYHRPAVKGRKIWGGLVPYGMNEGNKYSKNKPYPWRAGANENTTISFNHDVMIEGKKIAAGKYGLHMLPSEGKFKIMFNKVNDSWGSYSYNSDEDVLTVDVATEKAGHVEWLEYGFDGLSDTGATVYLRWEKLKIPFKVTVAN